MIKEEFLHYIWKNQLLPKKNLILSNGEELEIISFGEQNPLAGPDFFNAHLKIGNQKWAGNVEIHSQSHLWYAHRHETDPAYGNVILHIVWEYDVEVFDYQHNPIPTLEIKNLVSQEIINKYKTLFNHKNQFIFCEDKVTKYVNLFDSSFLEVLYIQRLKQKSEQIFNLLEKTQNDWEAVLFQMMMRIFAGNINAEIFEKVAQSIPFLIIRKELYNLQNLEALLFGKLNLLKKENIQKYSQKLWAEYQYQKKKYNLQDFWGTPHFFGLRPANFPTIRLAQLCQLYHLKKSLFSDILSLKNVNEFYDYLNEIQPSEFWKNHYTFEKESSPRIKKISHSLADLLWINVVIPIQFSYEKFSLEVDNQKFIEKIKQLSPEKNSILNQFQKLKISNKNAFESQSLLQLYKKYCTQGKCLECKIGLEQMK